MIQNCFTKEIIVTEDEDIDKDKDNNSNDKEKPKSIGDDNIPIPKGNAITTAKASAEATAKASAEAANIQETEIDSSIIDETYQYDDTKVKFTGESHGPAVNIADDQYNLNDVFNEVVLTLDMLDPKI